VRGEFHKLEQLKFGRPWSIEDVAIGMASDVGDVLRLVMACIGRRDIPDARTRLPGELADVLWSVLVIASELDIDLEKAFLSTMHEISTHIASDLAGQDVGEK
jgi:hypothetical protein